jgi:hypothetical protein
MIIKAIKELIETQTSLLQKKAGTFNVECAVDEEVVDCGEMDSPSYIGVPAPAYLEDDPWFGPAIVSDKGQDYMEKEAEIKQQEEENRQYWTNESDNIHQVMYEMATQSAATTLQLDPIGGSENFQGGSENVHR